MKIQKVNELSVETKTENNCSDYIERILVITDKV